jgi:hypothetical protein
LFSQSGDALAGPEGFAQLRHIEFVVCIVSDQSFAAGESKQEVPPRFVALYSVADCDLITPESSALLGCCDGKIPNFTDCAVARLPDQWADDDVNIVRPAKDVVGGFLHYVYVRHWLLSID